VKGSHEAVSFSQTLNPTATSVNLHLEQGQLYRIGISARNLFSAVRFRFAESLCVFVVLNDPHHE